MMNNFEPTNGAKPSEEVWHVQLSSGELRVMTLEQLDDAFQNGVVSENTFIYQVGMNDWIKLGDLAGLDGDEGDEGKNEGEAETADLISLEGDEPTPVPVS